MEGTAWEYQSSQQVWNRLPGKLFHKISVGNSKFVYGVSIDGDLYQLVSVDIEEQKTVKMWKKCVTPCRVADVGVNSVGECWIVSKNNRDLHRLVPIKPSSSISEESSTAEWESIPFLQAQGISVGNGGGSLQASIFVIDNQFQVYQWNGREFDAPQGKMSRISVFNMDAVIGLHYKTGEVCRLKSYAELQDLERKKAEQIFSTQGELLLRIVQEQQQQQQQLQDTEEYVITEEQTSQLQEEEDFERLNTLSSVILSSPIVNNINQSSRPSSPPRTASSPPARTSSFLSNSSSSSPLTGENIPYRRRLSAALSSSSSVSLSHQLLQAIHQQPIESEKLKLTETYFFSMVNCGSKINSLEASVLLSHFLNENLKFQILHSMVSKKLLLIDNDDLFNLLKQFKHSRLILEVLDEMKRVYPKVEEWKNFTATQFHVLLQLFSLEEEKLELLKLLSDKLLDKQNAYAILNEFRVVSYKVEVQQLLQIPNE